MNHGFAGRLLAGMLLLPLSARGQEAAGKHPPLLIASYSNNAAYTSKFPVFEVTTHKKVVWKFQNPAVGNPTHVKVLTPAEVGKFLMSGGGRLR